MLIDFEVKNFASFKNEAILSAQTGERLRKYKRTNTFQNGRVPILKNLLLFGPNGTGKSRLFAALRLMQEMVQRGGTNAVTDDLPYYPFMFDTQTRHSDTKLGITIEIERTVFEYVFTYNQTEISYEKLTVSRPNEKERVYFERQGQTFTVLPNSLKETVARLRKNALFLFLAQQDNDKIAGEIYRWFVEDIIYLGGSVNIPTELLMLMNQRKLKEEMVSFLQFADFNIVDINLRKVAVKIDNPQLEQLVKTMNLPLPKDSWQLFTLHKQYDENGEVIGTQELPLANESTGTQRIFYIVLTIIFSQFNGNKKTILIDEFDESLHHELADALVKIFNSEQNSNQFIIASHDLGLLDNELRIDQIYLLEKDFKGVSELKSIFDFTDSRNVGRLDVSFAKRYLQGQFGAMPVIDVDGLIDVLNSVHRELGKDSHASKKE